MIEANGFGTILTNHPGYYSDYNGIEFSLTKRLREPLDGEGRRGLERHKECYTVAENELGNPTRTDTTPLQDCGPFTYAAAAAAPAISSCTRTGR